MSKEKILIVDDDELVRDALAFTVEDEGYLVDTAADGKEGIEKIKTQSFDLVILDLKLPDTNGLAVLKTAKEINPDTVIIILTGYGSIESAKEAMKLGAFNYVAKPVDPHNLTTIIRETLSERKERLETKKLIEKPDVLVVDDEDIVCNTIKEILEDNRYSVDIARSGEEALEKIGKKDFHVLVVDLKLPGINGIELIEQARKTSRSEFLPIIITGYPSVESVVDAMKKGVYEYITKPIKPDKLIQTLTEGWHKRKNDILLSKLLRPGRSYLVKEEKPTKSFDIFIRLTKFAPGLCITQTHPDEVKEKYKLKTPILWLSKMERLDYAISLTAVSRLVYEINEFLEKSMGGVILLDGVENLIATNGFDLVIKYLHDIWDAVTLNKGMLLVPINPMAIGKKELALLERNMEIVKIE